MLCAQLGGLPGDLTIDGDDLDAKAIDEAVDGVPAPLAQRVTMISAVGTGRHR